MTDPPNETELFRTIMASNGPVVTESIDRMKDAVEVTAGRFDGKLSDPAVFVIAYGGAWNDVWFHSGEADIVLREVRPEVSHDIAQRMPYDEETITADVFVGSALDWPGAVHV